VIYVVMPAVAVACLAAIGASMGAHRSPTTILVLFLLVYG